MEKSGPWLRAAKMTRASKVMGAEGQQQNYRERHTEKEKQQ
jgi:hypothetical protein